MRWVPYNFTLPFQPSGPDCPDPFECCTNLAQSKAKSVPYLDQLPTAIAGEMRAGEENEKGAGVAELGGGRRRGEAASWEVLGKPILQGFPKPGLC
jgi:hypothetical protein